MGYVLLLELDQLPKSLNKKLRSNRFALNRENKAFDNIIACAVSGRLPNVPLTKAKISLVRHSHRFLDFDGVVGSFKPVVDALVSAGVLIDDSWKVLGPWTVDQFFRPKSEGPLLTISVVEADDCVNGTNLA